MKKTNTDKGCQNIFAILGLNRKKNKENKKS